MQGGVTTRFNFRYFRSDWREGPLFTSPRQAKPGSRVLCCCASYAINGISILTERDHFTKTGSGTAEQTWSRKLNIERETAFPSSQLLAKGSGKRDVVIADETPNDAAGSEWSQPPDKTSNQLTQPCCVSDKTINWSALIDRYVFV